MFYNQLQYNLRLNFIHGIKLYKRRIMVDASDGNIIILVKFFIMYNVKLL